jgi:hypothetical protein
MIFQVYTFLVVGVLLQANDPMQDDQLCCGFIIVGTTKEGLQLSIALLPLILHGGVMVVPGVKMFSGQSCRYVQLKLPPRRYY